MLDFFMETFIYLELPWSGILNNMSWFFFYRALVNAPHISSNGTNGGEVKDDGTDGEKKDAKSNDNEENDGNSDMTVEGKQEKPDDVKSPAFLQELLEEAADFCDVNEEELLESDSDIDESTLCLPKPISWPTALRLCKYNDKEARQMMRANKQGIRLQQKRRDRHFSTEKRRMYRPRKAKDTLREKIYSFNNPKEKGLLNCSARTLQDRIYNSMESCRQFASVAGRYAPKRHPTKTSLTDARRCEKEQDASTSDEASDIDSILSAVEDVDDEASESSGHENSMHDVITNNDKDDVSSSDQESDASNSNNESDLSNSNTDSENNNDDDILPRLLGTITFPSPGYKDVLEVDQTSVRKESSHRIGPNNTATAKSMGTASVFSGTLKRKLEQNDSQSLPAKKVANKVNMTNIL